MEYNRDLINKIEKKVQKRLSYDRYAHTIGVAGCAASLAINFEEDMYKAYIAGLLHDYSKEYSDDELLKIAAKNNLNINETEKKAPYLIHGKIAAIEAKNAFKIDDSDILNALRYHTSGRKEMSKLEKIIYISDYIEPHRIKFKGLDIIRKEAFNDLNNTMYLILKDTINYLKQENKPIDESTYDTYKFYEKLI